MILFFCTESFIFLSIDARICFIIILYPCLFERPRSRVLSDCALRRRRVVHARSGVKIKYAKTPYIINNPCFLTILINNPRIIDSPSWNPPPPKHPVVRLCCQPTELILRFFPFISSQVVGWKEPFIGGDIGSAKIVTVNIPKESSAFLTMGMGDECVSRASLWSEKDR